jgi:alginate O-acetyltransferase complex protein AlgI
LFLTLDRLFLRNLLDRCGAFVATAVTLFIVMIGWAIFRSESPTHLGPFLMALFGQSSAPTAPVIPSEVPLTLMLGAIIALFPATALFEPLKHAYKISGWLRLVTAMLLVLLYVFAIARSIAVPFQPFIYFRF